jgi:hypothetical protein
MLRTVSLLGLGLAAVALFVVAGCQQTAENPPQAGGDKQEAQSSGQGREDEHGHKPGSHGGNIVAIGRDSYHAEAVFEKDGVVRLYLLGQDESRVQEVEAQKLTAYARPEGGLESARFEIKPVPTSEDAAGKTSRFVGTLPRGLWGKQVEVTVPSIRIAGQRFRFAFKNASPAAHAAMPAGASSEEAKKLYLTPGGKYTAADIKANGGVTAGQKYGDKMSAHDANPRPGDRICPVTDTKANPEFTWVVGGKTYQFCCPPCIDEFVKTAKEKPDQIKAPGDYVKK